MRIYSPHLPLISLHIPKCAGQSFREALEYWFKDRFFIHYYQQRNSLPPKHPLKPGVCIHGHFNRTRGFGIMDYYPEIDQFITVLRDPLEAAISNYFFWKTRARAIQLKTGIITEGGEQDYRNIDDFFLKRPRSTMLDFMPDEMTEDNFKNIIETKFVWIGLVENFQAHVDVLARAIGVPTVTVNYLNRSNRDEELSGDLRNDFLKNNALEYSIYKYVAGRNSIKESERVT
jgi:hypothetical protein